MIMPARSFGFPIIRNDVSSLRLKLSLFEVEICNGSHQRSTLMKRKRKSMVVETPPYERGVELARLGEKESPDAEAAPRRSGVLRSFYLVLIALVALCVAIRFSSRRSSARGVLKWRATKLLRPRPRTALDASLHAVPRFQQGQPLAYSAVRAIGRGDDATAAASLAHRVGSTAAAITRLAAVITRPIVAAPSGGSGRIALPPQPAVHPLRAAQEPLRRGNEGRPAWSAPERPLPRALATLLRGSLRANGFDVAIDAAHCRGTPYRVATLGMETYCDCLRWCAADKRCLRFAAQLDGTFSCALYDEHAAVGAARSDGACNRSDVAAAPMAHGRSEGSSARMLYATGRTRAIVFEAAVPLGNTVHAAETTMCSASTARRSAAPAAATLAEGDTEEDLQAEVGGAESNEVNAGLPEAMGEWMLSGQQSWALFITFNSNVRVLEQTLGALQRASTILGQHIILIDNSSPPHAHGLLHSELYSFFEHFNAAKLDTVPRLMRKYRGAEAQLRLLRKLRAKYGAIPKNGEAGPQQTPVGGASEQPEEQRASFARAAGRRSGSGKGKGVTSPPLHSELARFYETHHPEMLSRLPELRVRVKLRDELHQQYGVWLGDAPSAFSTRLEERGLVREVFRLKHHLPRSDVQVGVVRAY